MRDREREREREGEREIIWYTQFAGPRLNKKVGFLIKNYTF